MKTYLNVPFAEKDKAKQLGARWDAEKKKWYIPDGLSLSAFQTWINDAQHQAPSLQADLLPAWLPTTCFGTKISTFLSKEEQISLKQNILRQNQGQCSICRVPSTASYLYMDWQYHWGDYPVQQLKQMQALCEACNMVKYYGLNRGKGLELVMLKHLARVRGCHEQEAKALVNERERLFHQFASVMWALDVKILNLLGFQINPQVVKNEEDRRRRENATDSSAVFRGLREGWY